MAEKDDEEDREIIYYYSREHRLERASPQVRAFNEESSSSARARRAAGSKGNIFLFVSVVMVCVMIILSSRVRAPSAFKLGGNDISLSITRNESGLLSLVIQKTIPKEGVFYTGVVDIAVSLVQKKAPEGSENPPPEIFMERFFLTLSEGENYSFELPFDGDEFYVIIETEEERIIRRIRTR